MHLHGRRIINKTMTQTPSLALLKTMRPPFLILTPACLFLGYAMARAEGDISRFDLFLVLLAGLCAHISVNMLNEYFDYKSGLDANTRRTPFSGGSGALLANPEIAGQVLQFGVISLGVTVLIGAYFLALYGAAILPIGLLGVATVLSYTPWLNRWPLLCLIAPGLGFGLLMVGGTYFVLTGSYNREVFTLSLVPFFLVNNLLLLNQIPDIDADREAGRRHFPIHYGLQPSLRIHTLFALVAGLLILNQLAVGYLPSGAAIALASVAAGLVAGWGIRRVGPGGNMPPFLALNVLSAIVTPVLLGICLLTQAG